MSPSVLLEHELVSLVMPAFNEGAHIRKNLEDCLRVVREKNIRFELVVVDDGSLDNTLAEMKAVANENHEVTVVSYTKNGGKGNALKEGCKKAKGDLIAFVDADLEIHPWQIVRFIDVMEKTGADVVIGSKRHPESKVDYPLKRRFLSWGYNIFLRIIFQINLTDTQPGFKLFRREVLEVELNKTLTKKYAFDLELLVNANEDGFKIVEAPIELQFSRGDGGRIGFKTIKSILQETLGIFYRLRVKGVYKRSNANTKTNKLN